MSNVTVTLQYKDYTIELFDDHKYVEDSADSPTCYDKVYKSEESAEYYCSSRHGIIIYANGLVYKSAILLEAMGATGLYSDAALIDDDCLIIRCSNKLYSLTLPNLEINWVVNPDWATYFFSPQIQGQLYHTWRVKHISRKQAWGDIVELQRC